MFMIYCREIPFLVKIPEFLCCNTDCSGLREMVMYDCMRFRSYSLLSCPKNSHGHIHGSRSHTRVKVTYTGHGHIHGSWSHTRVMVTYTGHGHIHGLCAIL